MSRTELMEIGEHCAFCGQIDFLPFKCSCKSSFCSQHRAPEAHNCSNLKKTAATSTSSTSTSKDGFKDLNLPSASSLFPDRSKTPQIQLKTTDTHPTNLSKTLIKENKSSALFKLKKFFEKASSKSKKPSVNPSKRIVETAQLKNKSKGDSKIPQSERIHIWVQVIDDDETSPIDKDTKTPMFISRGWPLGRGLDSLASQLNLKNINNRTQDASQRLFLFKIDQKNPDQFVKLNTSDRCSSLQNGDYVYIVRGTEH